MLFTPTRDAGHSRLHDFLPRSGRAYANNRGHDGGQPPGEARTNVSQLSPWLHAGLVGERETIEAVLEEHGPKAGDKFISEVFWRIYFKGYLEQRPGIWRHYCEGRDEAFGAIDGNSGRAKAYSEAIEGRTGIEAFDHWARELVDIGYLHNHARMWFASIWIFTLKLDWQLGADFFLRHLLDGDAASNTLSWRWVAGLHTKGKTYLARPDNIARYTADQPDGPLRADGLAEDAPALEEDADHPRRKLTDLPAPFAHQADALSDPYALILHDERAHPDLLDLPHPPALVIGAARPLARSSGNVSDKAREFAQQAVECGTADAAAQYGCKAMQWRPGDTLADILAEAGIDRVALPYLPTGWTHDALLPELTPLIDEGRAVQGLSELDAAVWPHAKAGFFGVKKKIESIMDELAITGAKMPAPS